MTSMFSSGEKPVTDPEERTTPLPLTDSPGHPPSLLPTSGLPLPTTCGSSPPTGPQTQPGPVGIPFLCSSCRGPGSSQLTAAGPSSALPPLPSFPPHQSSSSAESTWQIQPPQTWTPPTAGNQVATLPPAFLVLQPSSDQGTWKPQSLLQLGPSDPTPPTLQSYKLFPSPASSSTPGLGFLNYPAHKTSASPLTLARVYIPKRSSSTKRGSAAAAPQSIP